MSKPETVEEIAPESDRVDPTALPKGYTPAVVDVRERGPVFVADYYFLSSDWVAVKQWDGRRAKVPPRRVQSISELRIERHGEPDEAGHRPLRVADEDWRRKARAVHPDQVDGAPRREDDVDRGEGVRTDGGPGSPQARLREAEKQARLAAHALDDGEALDRAEQARDHAREARQLLDLNENDERLIPDGGLLDVVTDEFPVASGTVSDPDGATAYQALAVRVRPDDHPELQSAGFHSPQTLYVLFSPGGRPLADYDPYQLKRECPGHADWLIDQLKALSKDAWTNA